MAQAKLPKGTKLDPAGSAINIGDVHGVPLGRFTAVVNSNGDSVGFVKDGIYHNLGDKVIPTVAPRDSKGWQFEINRLKTIEQHQSNDLDNYSTDSKEYKDGVALVKTTQKQISDAQQKLETTKIAEKKIADAKQTQQTATVQKKTSANAQQDLSSLADERKRIADLGGDTSKVDAQIAAIVQKNPTPTTSGTAPTTGKPAQTTKTFIDGLLRDSKVTTSSTTKPVSKPTGTASTKGTGTSSTTKVVVPPVVPADPAKFMADYGVQAALINSDPSLKALFDKAMKGKWDGPRFKAEMLNTQWAQTHSAEWQANQTAMLESPATYAGSYNRMREHIAQLAVQEGLAITPDQIGPEAKADGSDVVRRDNTITQWALDQYGANGFNDAALMKHIAAVGQINLSLPGGTAANDIMALKKYAGQMGLGNMALPPSNDPYGMGNDWFAASAKSNLLGTTTLDTQKAYLLEQAKQQYTAFAPSLDAGQTVQNLAAPYINTLSNLLEITPDQIDLSSPTGYGKMVHDALTGLDPANQKPIPLYDFEKQIKARPEWGMTNNARDTIMPGVGDLLKKFGKVS